MNEYEDLMRQAADKMSRQSSLLEEARVLLRGALASAIVQPGSRCRKCLTLLQGPWSYEFRDAVEDFLKRSKENAQDSP